jgi:anti-sigma regulatory factor (Ser/Thr protein kinase)
VGMELARYSNAPTAPSDARLCLMAALRATSGIDEEGVQDAALIVSELVTNALRAGSNAVCIDLEKGEAYVRISVIDDAPGLPRRQDAAEDVETGRGLAIVSALATAWGVTERPDAKEVWADIARTRAV